MRRCAASDDLPKRRVFASIQHLRGLAASMVVVHHSAESYPGSPISTLNLGQSGVATFFAISGFIIWTSSRRETVAQFVKRRLIRIVPMYWLALAVVLAIGIHSWGKPVFAPSAIVQSMLFIPYFAGTQRLMLVPLLVPGWTLNFEMMFYAVFAVGMVLRRPLLVPVAALGGMFIMGQLVHFTFAPLVLYTNWLCILFIFGVIIGERAPANRAVAALWPLALPIIVGFNFMPYPHFALTSAIVLLIAGVTAQERVWWPRIPPLAALGDASYAIYLFHIPVSFVLNVALTRAHAGNLPWPIYAPLFLCSSLVVGLAVHRHIEKPLGKLLSRTVGQATASSGTAV